MKKPFALTFLVCISLNVFAQKIELSGESTYEMGEFDTINSAKEIGISQALKSIANLVPKKVMSIRKLDANSLYTRASWVVQSSIVSQKTITNSVDLCKESSNICITTEVKAIVDTDIAKQDLLKVYSDSKLLERFELLIKQKEKWSVHVAKGMPVDLAIQKDRLNKETQILNYLAKQRKEKNAAILSDSLISMVNTGKQKSIVNTSNANADNFLYKSQLVKLKDSVKVKVHSQTLIENSDGSRGVRFEVSFNTGELINTETQLLELLTHNKNTVNYFDKFDGVTVLTIGVNGSFDTEVEEIVNLGIKKDLVTSPDLDYFQYAIKTKYRDDGRFYISYEKLNLITLLSNFDVCTDFSFGNSPTVRKCLVEGGKKIMEGAFSKDWDHQLPYVAIARSDSKFNLYFKLGEELILDNAQLNTIGLNYETETRF